MNANTKIWVTLKHVFTNCCYGQYNCDTQNIILTVTSPNNLTLLWHNFPRRHYWEILPGNFRVTLPNLEIVQNEIPQHFIYLWLLSVFRMSTPMSRACCGLFNLNIALMTRHSSWQSVFINVGGPWQFICLSLFYVISFLLQKFLYFVNTKWTIYFTGVLKIFEILKLICGTTKLKLLYNKTRRLVQEMLMF
jgi:hypothetical protein